MLRIKARLVGTSCELERVGCAGGLQGGGTFCNKGKGSRSEERREGWDIFGTGGKSQLANVFSR